MYSGIGSFFREGCQLFRKNFGKLFLYNLYLFLIALAVLLFFTFATIIGFSSIYTGTPEDSLPTESIVLFFVLIIFLGIIGPVLIAGYQHLYVKLIRKEKVSFKNIFAGFKHFWSIWVTHFFTQVIGFGGTILFLLPLLILVFANFIAKLNLASLFFNTGYWFSHYWYYLLPDNMLPYLILPFLIILAASFYWACKLLFTGLAALDRRLSPGDAIYYTNNITKGFKLKIFLNLFLPFILLGIVLNIVTTLTEDIWPLGIIIALLFNLLNLFIIIPLGTSIIAAAYVQLSDQFDNYLPGNIVERFTVKKNSRNNDSSENNNQDKDN